MKRWGRDQCKSTRGDRKLGRHGQAGSGVSRSNVVRVLAAKYSAKSRVSRLRYGSAAVRRVMVSQWNRRAYSANHNVVASTRCKSGQTHRCNRQWGRCPIVQNLLWKRRKRGPAYNSIRPQNMRSLRSSTHVILWRDVKLFRHVCTGRI